jgi:hypothetical protein
VAVSAWSWNLSTTAQPSQLFMTSAKKAIGKDGHASEQARGILQKVQDKEKWCESIHKWFLRLSKRKGASPHLHAYKGGTSYEKKS